jgi:CII-binding regulator of phage lambda lysogenization HflD
MSPLKLPKLPVKPRKSNKRTSKVYRAKEARLELGLETLTNTLDLEDKEVKTCCLSKDILSKVSLST